MSSLMGKLFGGGGGAPKPRPAQNTTAETIQKINEAIEMLDKKSKHLDKKILDELREAKRLGTKNKKEAMRHLVRKNRYQKQQSVIDGQRDTLEAQICALEISASDRTVVEALKDGAQALKKNQQNADEIGDIIDQVTESDELEAELEGLEQEELDAELLAVGTTGTALPEVDDDLELPDVPAVPLPAKAKATKVKNDDDELAELAAWVNG